MPPKQKRFRLRVAAPDDITSDIPTTGVFLTYARCPIKKEHALELLQAMFGNIRHYIVAEELHKDGFPHLHVFLSFTEYFQANDHTFADLVVFDDDGEPTIYHGKYEAARSINKVCPYCAKDGDYIANVDVKSLVSAKMSHRSFGEQLLAKTPLHKLVAEHPQYIFQYANLRKSLNQLAVDSTVPRMRNLTASWRYGPSRTGKSWDAIKELGCDPLGDLSPIYFKPS